MEGAQTRKEVAGLTDPNRKLWWEPHWMISDHITWAKELVTCLPLTQQEGFKCTFSSQYNFLQKQHLAFKCEQELDTESITEGVNHTVTSQRLPRNLPAFTATQGLPGWGAPTTFKCCLETVTLLALSGDLSPTQHSQLGVESRVKQHWKEVSIQKLEDYFPGDFLS